MRRLLRDQVALGRNSGENVKASENQLRREVGGDLRDVVQVEGTQRLQCTKKLREESGKLRRQARVLCRREYDMHRCKCGSR